jgi:hypothetical protein
MLWNLPSNGKGVKGFKAVKVNLLWKEGAIFLN